MAIPTDTLPELNSAAAFLQCADSPRAKAHLRASLRRIQKAHRVGDPQLPYLIQKYLTSYDARIAASRLAAKKMRWYRRPNKTELKSIAESLNAFQGTQEEVRLQPIRKSANTFRPTLDFGSENRALQNLVLSVLCAVAELHPRQFATHGGVPAAIAQVANAMRAGYVHATEIDIKDFYASFDGNKLVDLVPVQKRVIERILLSEHLNIFASISHHTDSPPFGPANTDPGEAPFEKYLADARRGIPQGSAASPILAEMLLAPLLFQVPAGGQVVAYADNILLMAKSKSDADAMTESFGSALKEHPAGQLWPKIKSFSAGGPIDFLGHRLTAHGDEVRVQPSPENREKFERKMESGLAQLRKPTLTPAARQRLLQDLKSDLSSHVTNFRRCDGMKEYRKYWSAQIASAEHAGSTTAQSKPPPIERIVFWPHRDQEEIITAALDLAKNAVSTQCQTVALVAIARVYTGAGTAFKDWTQALDFDRKRTQDPAAFAHQVLTFLQQLCPELVLETEITWRSSLTSTTSPTK